MKRIIESKEFWEQQLVKLKASNLSRSQYCRANGINYDRFGYWIKKLSSVSPKFIPVKLQAPEVAISNATLCTIEMRGHIIKIHEISALSFVLEKLA